MYVLILFKLRKLWHVHVSVYNMSSCLVTVFVLLWCVVMYLVHTVFVLLQCVVPVQYLVVSL